MNNMTEADLFLYIFIVWFTIKWTLYVNIPDKMRRKAMSQSIRAEPDEHMPASANMAMSQSMND